MKPLSNDPFDTSRPDQRSAVMKMDPTAQAELDLLVDDELPETRRSALLRRMDQFSDGWRQIALCFLEHQAQRRAFRELVSGNANRVGHEKSVKQSGAPHRFLTSENLRIAAAVLLTATIFSLAGIYEGRRAASVPAGQPFLTASGTALPSVAETKTKNQPRQIQMLTHSLPAQFGSAAYFGNQYDAAQSVPTAYPAGSGNADQNQIMVVGAGPNRVMAFPLSPVGKNGRPVY